MILTNPMEQLAAEDFSTRRKSIGRRERVNSGEINLSQSQNTSDDLDVDKMLVLKRDNTVQSKGYFFLAVIFGMMSCSSYGASGLAAQQETANELRSQLDQQFNVGRDLKSKSFDSEMQAQFEGMNLAQSDVGDEYMSDEQMSNYRAREGVTTARLMKNIDSVSHKTANMGMSDSTSNLFRSLVSGKYTYLTYLMCSTACFFFWSTPNQYKIRHIRPRKSKKVIDV